MTDPKQLLEQWIDAERSAEPSPATRAANWDGLQSRLAAAAAPTPTAAGGLGKVLAAVLAVGGTGLVALALARGPAPDAATTDGHVLEDRDGPPANEPVSEDMHRSAEAVPEDIHTPHLGPAEAEAEALAPHVPEDMPIPPAPSGSPEPPIPHVPEDMPESPSGWDAELALLQRTQSALRDGRAAEAVAHADEYRQRWPRGVFIEEIEAARVLGLCAQDDPAAARKAAAGFHRAWAHSLYAAKIDQSCPDSRARARRTDEAADTTH
ncbi:hypothetical protein [Nannocystis pusilla]|uniref:hypothetical protein n=1 Tax=Nannocystis pusilla TaxID=889268 RepID=UPI003B787887